MEVENTGQHDVTIRFTSAELALICNSMLQAYGLLSAQSFHARTGRTREYAEELHLRLSDILDQIRGGPNEGSLE